MGYRTSVLVLAMSMAIGAQAFEGNSDGGDGTGDSPFLPKIVNVEVRKTYVPTGFDDNDRIQLMAAGTFPNTCYKVGHYTTEIDAQTKTIRIRQSAYQYFGVCLNLVVPFSQIVDLGPLKAGTWQLVDASSGKAMSSFSVTRSTKPEPDEYLYAPVSDAYVHRDAATGKDTVTLQGTFTDRCTQLKEVRVHYYPEVIVVQPIAVHIEKRDGCAYELVRFSETVNLAEGLKGTYLLHVRAMNGQAISKLVPLGE